MNADIMAYRDIIETCNQRIKDIQTGCEHDNCDLGMYMSRPGAMSPQRICADCDAIVPGITEEEAAPIWDEFNKEDISKTNIGGTHEQTSVVDNKSTPEG